MDLCDEFGASVFVSGDTALVGALRDDCSAGDDCGAAYVFRFDGTSWVQQQKLTASDAAPVDYFEMQRFESLTRARVELQDIAEQIAATTQDGLVEHSQELTASMRAKRARCYRDHA